jgi:uncharacterized protein YciI
MKYAVMNWMIRPDLVMTSKEAIGALIEHTRYMKGLEEEGKVIMAGGFMDGTGGMDIIECETLDEAVEISQNDPLVKANLIRQDIKAWSTDLEARNKMFTQMFENLG